MNIDYIVWAGISLEYKGLAHLPKKLRKDLERLERSYGMEDGIEFKGLKFQQVPWYATNNSWREGFGVVIYQYDASANLNDPPNFRMLSDKIEQLMPQIKEAFLALGIKEEPKTFQHICSSDWSQG